MDTDKTIFEMLVWGGAALTLAGLALLVWCIIRVSRARRAHATDPEELRAALHAVVPANLAALCLSALGLMLVVIGIILS